MDQPAVQRLLVMGQVWMATNGSVGLALVTQTAMSLWMLQRGSMSTGTYTWLQAEMLS